VPARGTALAPGSAVAPIGREEDAMKVTIEYCVE
jgi:hypothetical protein